ncbi:MAG: Pfs, NACHT and Ankyrin protein [uncultured bacterium]|nr:MAG: Pfs, NACHT and Ankyrin protein [uncultured bacterium]
MQAAPFVLSEALAKQGNLVKADCFSGVYTREDLIAYLRVLKDRVKELTYPVVFALHAINHTIAIGYDPARQGFINADTLPVQLLSLSKARIEELADKIMAAFSNKGVSIFATEMYVTQRYYNEQHVVIPASHVKLWEKIHARSRKKVNALDTFNASWLIIAAQNNDLDSVKALLKRHANPNHLGCGFSALCYAIQHGNFEMIRLLLEAGACVGPLLLGIAAKSGRLNVVEILFEKGANLHQLSDGLSALYFAAQRGHFEIVKFLLDKGADPNQPGSSASLYIAAKNGHLEVVKLLLAKGADPNQFLSNMMSPLCIAAENNHLEVLRLLLQWGAHPNLTSMNGLTPLLTAVLYQKHAILQEMLQRPCPWINQCVEIKEKEVAYYLLEKMNLQKNLVDHRSIKINPLMVAVLHQEIDSVTLLLKNGANPSLIGVTGVLSSTMTPIQFARTLGNRDLQTLLEQEQKSRMYNRYKNNLYGVVQNSFYHFVQPMEQDAFFKKKQGGKKRKMKEDIRPFKARFKCGKDKSSAHKVVVSRGIKR